MMNMNISPEAGQVWTRITNDVDEDSVTVMVTHVTDTHVLFKFDVQSYSCPIDDFMKTFYISIYSIPMWQSRPYNKVFVP
jgi:hypothetical protein